MQENNTVFARKSVLCVLKDAKSNVYFPPSVYDNQEAAKRSFHALIKRGTYFVFSNFPTDFDLWLVGEYDDLSGTITPTPAPVHLANGADFANN